MCLLRLLRLVSLTKKLQALSELSEEDATKFVNDLDTIKGVVLEEVDDQSAQLLHDVIDRFNAIVDDSDVLSATEMSEKFRYLKDVVLTVQKYCFAKDALKHDGIMLYDILNQMCLSLDDYDSSIFYGEKYLEEIKKLGDEEEIVNAKAFLATSYHSAAVSIAACVFENGPTDGTYNTELIPAEDRKHAEELNMKSADLFHEAYIDFTRLALKKATEMKLVDASLQKRVDDDHLVETMETLTKAVDECKDKESEGFQQILDYLDNAMEMNENCLENDGTSFDDIVMQITRNMSCDSCDSCGSYCSCGEEEEDDEEEEEEEEKEEEKPAKKACKRESCHKECCGKKCKH